MAVADRAIDLVRASTMGSEAPQLLLDRAAAVFRRPITPSPGPVACGVDLGTDTCVLVVLDKGGLPCFLDAMPSRAVRDGVVVDFQAPVAAVTALKQSAEQSLHTTLTHAWTAYPPAVGMAESRACRFVVESAGFVCAGMVDEVSAAQALLQVVDGVIADVGGGSTGVGVYRAGKLVALGDRPGGGHHLDLILAGALGLSLEEARQRKLDAEHPPLELLRPGFERIAHTISTLTLGHPHSAVHLVGGATLVPGAAAVIEAYLGRPVVSYHHALYATPLGIALSALER